MNDTAAPPPAPAEGPLTSTLYRLVEEKLGHAPIGFIRRRREVEGDGKPMAYTRIAEELRDASGVYLTHEAVRRWDKAGGGSDTDSE